MADDVYAVYIANSDWPSLRAALLGDERLAVVNESDGESIQRSIKDRTDSSRVLGRFLFQVATPIHAVVEEAIQFCRKLHPMKRESRLSLASTELFTTQGGGAKDLVNTWASGNLDYSLIAITGQLTNPQDPWFSRLLAVPFEGNSQLLVPNGNLREMEADGVNISTVSDQDIRTYAREGHITGRVNLDPVTLTSRSLTLVYTYSPLGPVAKMGEGQWFPLRIETPKLDWTTILGTKAKSELEARSRASESLLGDKSFQTELPEPLSEPIPTTDILLKSAERKRVNLVCYVSPFTDFHLSSGKTSIADAIGRVNQRKIDLAWIDHCTSHRVAEVTGPHNTVPFDFDGRLTVSMNSGILVVRNELRFLDGLREPDGELPTGFANSLRRGETIKLDSLVEALAQLPVSSWKTSYYSSRYLTICDPVAFKPFAMAIRKSPKLRQALRDAAIGKPYSIPFPDVEPSAREALVEGIVTCARCSDGDGVSGDEAMIRNLLRDQEGRDPKIRIEKTAERTLIRFVQYGETPWAVALRNVDFN